MNINQIKAAIPKIWKYKKTPFIMGSPGLGKTEAIYQIGKETNREVFYLHPNNYEPVDITGLPYLGDSYTSTNKKTIYSESGIIPSCNFTGILLIDELPQANISMQNALSRLIQERRVGSTVLNTQVDIVVTGNRLEDRAGTNKVPTHIANRTCLLPMEFHIDHFIQYAREIGLDDTAIAFARYRPDIFDFKPNQLVNCSPRSFCNASYHLEDDSFDIIAGYIGEAVASELRAYKAIWKELPEFEDILTNAETLSIPDKADIRFSVLMMLVSRTTQSNITTLLKYVYRFPIEERVKYFKDLVLAKFPLSESPELMAWWKENKELFN